MAITTQPKGGHSRDLNGNLNYQHVEKGPYDDILAVAQGRKQGDVIPGIGTIQHWYIDRTPGGLGIVTYMCGISEEETGGGQVSVPLRVVWGVRNMQVSIPLMRYCGPSEGANAQWYDVKMWRNETDKDLFDSYKYLGKHGEVALSDPSIELADKIKMGHESVMRFYPVVTCTSTFGSEPIGLDIGERLSYIDTPAKYSSAAPVFLKIQDDLDELPDRSYRRVESWQGADALDADFYGEDRWAFGSI